MYKNVLGKKIQICNLDPVTGYNRNGYCYNYNNDKGTHIVCSSVTDKFLKYTLSKGNDLITPRNNFPGLKVGDKWCLCVHRWIEAYNNNAAPLIILKSTSESILKYIPMDIVLKYGI